MDLKKQKIENFLERKIKRYKFLKSGFSSNENYLVDDNIHVHFTNNNIDHENEIKAYKLYGTKIFKMQNGNFAKEFFEGRNPNFENKKELKKVIKEIKKFHKLPNHNFDEHGINVYLQSTKIDSKLILEFKSLISLYELEPKVLIHGDINPTNIIIKENVKLIDFEWVRKGPAIIDFASIIAFSNADINFVCKETNIDKNKLISFTRLVLIHTLMWCEKQNSILSNKLRLEVNKKLKEILTKL
ncbi:MAG: phosphotransferase [Mycoplasma sp.]|nr:phosphotransferase [Mycoplasma sp.]